MRNSFYLYAIGITLMAMSALVSCSSDDDESDNNLSPSIENISGTWICYEQTWYEGGTSRKHTYSGYDYYIIFNNDRTGSMNSGTDELMEIGRSHKFSYTVADNKIVSNIFGEEIWTIVSLSKSNLVLRWEDGDYQIECKFNKFGNDEDNDTLTKQTLIGHWVCLACTNEYGTERTWDINDLQLATGDYLSWTIDFFEDGTGYKNTGAGNNMFLGSTSKSFRWSFSDNTIKVSVLSYEEGDWKVESYKNGTLVLSAVNGKYKATLKKGSKSTRS